MAFTGGLICWFIIRGTTNHDFQYPIGIQNTIQMSYHVGGRGIIHIIGSEFENDLITIESYFFQLRNDSDIILTTNIDNQYHSVTRDELKSIYEIDSFPSVVYVKMGEVLGIYSDFDELSVNNLKMWYELISRE